MKKPEDVSPKPSVKRTLLSALRGLFRLRADKSSTRLIVLGLGFVGVFGVIAGRVAQLAATAPETTGSISRSAAADISAARPDIVDRNGELLATDVKVFSVFAEPRKIIDKDEAVELLTAVMPDLNARELRERMNQRRGFIWVKREITPRQQAETHRLGIPGIGFLPENKRVYPNGPAAAHVLGFANVDNVGIAGIEKHIDTLGLQDLNGAGFALSARDMNPIRLSVDLRVQHALRDELAKGLEKFRAKAASAAIMDVNSGEVIALVSLPDYDPNNPADALQPDKINRINVGVFEMGSTFKALTTAMALDSGKFNLNSMIDSRAGTLRYGGRAIHDYNGGKNRALSIPEIFIYSSNIGSAKLALGIGVDGHKEFLRKAGQLERLITELPENARPIVPSRWSEVNTATIGFGHGLAVAPLQALSAVAALTNGGVLLPPTFLKRSAEEAKALGSRLVKPETSEAMRYLLRLNAEMGSATRANVPGFYVGGKTGTAEKVIGGRYSKNKNLATFMAVVPADKPRYLFLTILDEPQAINGAATGGLTSAPVTGRMIERIGPMLGVEPRFEPPRQPFPGLARYQLKIQQ
ncbi:MAG: penicillin-binding protein [Rhizobiales bacterium 65-9]|nr:MAG: penicillin-binding protein [Rhizobiales bacterium 65-9]